MTRESWSLTAAALAAIEEHGRSAYPEECCGFLVAPATKTPDGHRQIEQAIPTPNRATADRNRRYVIDPLELLRVERAVAPTAVVVGIYHSHPDHPAVPSEYDRERAWPWYSYLVLSVPRVGAPTIGAFEWDPTTRQFHPRRLRIEGAAPSGPPGTRKDGTEKL